MKKLITGILATLTCLCCFTGCGLLGGTDSSSTSNSSSSSEGSVAGIEDAKAYLESLYKNNDDKVTRQDYEVLPSITVEGVAYSIAWSVDVTEGVAVVTADGKVTIDVAEDLDADLAYVLTATLTAPDGSTTTVSFNRTVEAAPVMVAAPIEAAPVEDVAYKFYVYQAKNATDCYINGQMANTYYFATKTNFEEGIDVYVEYLEGSEDSFYLYHITDEENKTKEYINIVQSGTHTNAKYQDTATTAYVFDTELGTIVTMIGETKWYLGCDGTYNTVEPQKQFGDNYFMGYLVSLVDRTTVGAAVKVEAEYNKLSINTTFVSNDTIELPVTGTTYPDVKIAWACEDTDVTFNGKDMTIASVADTKTVTLTATVSCGEEVETKEFVVTLVKNTTEAIIDAVYALKDSEKFGNEVSLTAVVIETSDLYVPEGNGRANVTAKLVVKGSEDQVLGAYRMVADSTDSNASCSNVKVGDCITITGILTKHYSGGPQFDGYSTFVTAPAPSVADKVALEMALMDVETEYTEDATDVALPTTGKYFSDVTIAWSVNTNANVSYDANGLDVTLTETAGEATLTAVFSIDTVTETKTYTITTAAKVSGIQTLATFDLGENGSATHADGSAITSAATFTSGSYTLTITPTGENKVYTGAVDAQGNSCIKLGTSSKVGSFTFTVPENVKQVVIYVAKYKANTTYISVNGGETITLTKNSNDGEYDEIKVDTSSNSNKTVSFTTVSGGVRAMINTIEFLG